MMGKFHGYPGAVERFIFSHGMTYHQCRGERGACLFYEKIILTTGNQTQVTRGTDGFTNFYTTAESI